MAYIPTAPRMKAAVKMGLIGPETFWQPLLLQMRRFWRGHPTALTMMNEAIAPMMSAISRTKLIPHQIVPLPLLDVGGDAVNPGDVPSSDLNRIKDFLGGQIKTNMFQTKLTMRKTIDGITPPNSGSGTCTRIMKAARQSRTESTRIQKVGWIVRYVLPRGG
jgi:hypothetical protein